MAATLAGTQQMIPRGGLRPAVDSLVKAIGDNKGEILLRAKSEKIIVRDGVAKGVEARDPDGEISIEAKVVVSDAGPKKTVELAGEQNFDKGYVQEVKNLKPEQATEYDPKKEYGIFLADLHETFPNFEKQGGEVLLSRHYKKDWPTLRAFPSAPHHRRT